MKIYTCIPSLNEGDTIGSVTKLVDNGLQDLQSDHGQPLEAKIINVDSASEDRTVEIFNNIETHFPKQSIVLEEPRGKGRNIFAFMQIAREEEVDFCLMIDADIHSAKPEWIKELLTPLLNNQADFVTPLYKRSRFEGSTTNHFAYPIVLATTGASIRQPIAGDFAFSSTLLSRVEKLEIPDDAHNYGVDIFLTLAALTGGLRHQQIELGQKMHKPSFDKLEYMFPQIAASALSILRQTGIKKSVAPQAKTSTNIASSLAFPHKKEANLMRERAISQLKPDEVDKWSWVSKDVLSKLETLGQIGISLDDWVSIFSGWLRFGLDNKMVDANLLAKQLLPFFVLRVTNFWFDSEKITDEEVERLINKQAMALHKSFN